jgi:hypothetical protein
MSVKILRELSPSEKVLDYETRSCSLMDSRSFLISSKIDIYENIELVTKAIIEWKRVHNLLRACIHIDPENPLMRSLALASNEVINSNENVKFLKYDSNNHRDLWKILLENDIFKPYNHETGLLWRLYFIKEDDSFSYRIIFTVHHAIIDGRAHFCLIQQLLQLIERIYLNKQFELESYEILPSIETLLLSKLSETTNNDNQEAVIESYKIPDYFKPKIIPGNSSSSLGNLYTHDGNFYASIDSIINENKNKSFTKFLSFEVESEKLFKILNKCKLNKLKLTGN